MAGDVDAGSDAGAVERFRLTPDLQAPARARRRLLDFLVRNDGLQFLETAALLATELVTNVVIHAGTDLDLVLTLQEGELTVEVADRHPARLLTTQSPSRELPEGGRGLALVDALSTRWGTTHSRVGKSVWFTLGGSAVPVREAEPVLVDAASTERRSALLSVSPELEARLSLDEIVGELLSRLLDTVGADAGQVEMANGDGPRVVATRGDTRHLGGDGSRVVLPLSTLGQDVGQLVVAAESPDAFTDEDRGWVELFAWRMAVTVRVHQAGEAEATRRGWAAFLAEASELLAGSLDVSQTLALLCQLAVSRLADWAAVFMGDGVSDGGAELKAVSVAHVAEDELGSLRERLAGVDFSALIAGRTGGAVPVRIGDEAGVAVPLRARGRGLGWLALLRPSASQFRPEEVAVVVDLAHRAALAIDNGRLFGEQLAVARALQSGLLPPQLPPPGELDFGACYHAAREGLAVGGDFYDVIRLAEDEWVLAIGDVCGKGAEAAAVTGVARDVLRLLVRQGNRLVDSLHQLNETLRYGEHGRFCTVAAARIRRNGDTWSLSVCSAGHPLPALLGPGGAVRLAGSTGTLLGVLPEDQLDLAETELELLPGHALVLYTDGITERRRGSKQFGEQGLLAALRDCTAMSAQAVAGHIDRAAFAFADEVMRDDTAVLVARVPTDGRYGAVGPQRSTTREPAATRRAT